MQKSCIFGFSRFLKNFFAQNTCLYTGNNSRPFPQLCACFLRRFWNFDARDFEATHSASLLPKSKFEIFKKFSLVKFSTNFAFPVSSDLTDTFLFWKIFCGSRFKASWARVCVWRKFSKFLKKKVTFLGKTPLCKSPKISYFLYPQTSLILFYFIRFFLEARFEGSGSGVVFAKVAKVVIIQRLLCYRYMKNLYFV